MMPLLNILMLIVLLLLVAAPTLAVIALVKTSKQSEEIQILRDEVASLRHALFSQDKPQRRQSSSVETIPFPEEAHARSMTPQKSQKAIEFTPPKPPHDSYPPSKKRKASVELVVGRNVIGIVASALIFLGLIFLGILIVPSMDDSMKIAAMFSISSVFSIVALVLLKRKIDIFGSILLGCGFGSFFISIMFTHLYFHALGDIAAFSLLLLWMVICFAAIRWTHSLIVSIVCHVGMITSICFAFLGGVSDEKLALLLLYQAAAIAIICVGNMICSRRTYRFGLFASLLLTVIASLIMWSRFMGDAAGFATTLPVTFICVAFILEFIEATFLAYLIFVSIVRIKQTAARVILHITALLFWMTAVVIDAALLCAKLYYALTLPKQIYLGIAPNYTAVFIFLAVLIGLLLLYTVFILTLRSWIDFDHRIEEVSVLSSAILSGIALITNYHLMGICQQFDLLRLPGLVFIAIVLSVIEHRTHERSYGIAANIFIALDAIWMVFGGFANFTSFCNGSIVASLFYLLFILVFMAVRYATLDSARRADITIPFRAAFCLTIEAALLSVLIGSDLDYRLSLALLLVGLLLLALYASGISWSPKKLPIFEFGFDTASPIPRRKFIDTQATPYEKENQAFYLALRINEFVFFFVSAAAITVLSAAAVDKGILLVVALIDLILIAMRVRDASREESKPFEVLLGIAFTLLVLALIQGNTTLFEQGSALSIVCMLTAFVCILTGFMARIKIMRLYGLVLMLFCIYKLALLDLEGLESAMRVVAFIGSGVICFCISTLYNYAAKKLDT